MSKFTTTLASLALALGVSATAASATTTINFTTSVVSSVDSNFLPSTTFLGETGSGSISYEEMVGVDDYFNADLSLTLTMFGQTFSSADDEFGSAQFTESANTLTFSVSEVSFFNSTAIILDGLESFVFSGPIFPDFSGGNEIEVNVFLGDGTCTTNCNLAPIPVPAALPLALMGFGLMGWVSRRRDVA